MKKISYSIMLIVLCNLIIYAQKTSETNSVSAKTNAKVVEREKFDPARIAADDLKNAISTAQTENKRIILDVGGEWCIWCRWMDEYLMKNQDVAKLRDENFVWLKVNMSEENENKEFLSPYPKATGYPHLYVLEKDGTFLYSQDTAKLEEGKSYNKEKFTAFLKKWSPTRDLGK